ncbi:PLD nuclease N-terminal domain-containing protein [Microbacterium sp.]|uniref:PLD nuclease N-terminal domain-containing protein n=1 Tax=Microbacterium sp. TaxID=51671 RepID=UPI003F9772F4
MSETENNPLLPAAYDVVWSVAVLGALLLLVIALVSLSRTAKRITSFHALIWTLAAIFIPYVGPLSWLFIGRRAANAPRETRSAQNHTGSSTLAS